MAKFDSSRRSRVITFALLLALFIPGSAIKPFAQSNSQSAESSEFTELSKGAMEALDADRLDAAIPLFQKALALNPKWAEGWWSLGTSLYDQNRYAEASLAFEKVVALDPKHGTAHALLGLSLFEMGDSAGALKNIEESKEYGTNLDPQLRDVIFYHEGILLQRMGHFVAAQKPFASLCLGGNRNPDVMRAFGMAALHIRSQELPVPGSEEQQVVDLAGKGACLAAYKDFDGAKEVFTNAVTRFPKFPFVHYAFGRELVDAREIPAAVEQFKIEAKQAVDPTLSYLQIAAAEYKVNSIAGLPYARDAVRLSPREPFAHFLYGLLLMDTSGYKEAIPELEIASKGMSRDPKVFWSLAAAYGHAGRTQDAARARAKFAELKQQEQTAEASENPDVQVNTAGSGPDK